MIDPITLAVLNGRLAAIADEMNATLFRTAFSPIISEGRDACHGIYHPETGGILVQGHSSLPIFVGTMGVSVKALIDRAADGLEIREGDVFLTNDPYVGGTHVNDIRLIRPIFDGDRLVCFLASVGHWIDVAGNVPGNFNPMAIDCFQEGLQIPLVRIANRDGINEDILAILLQNSRVPEKNHGDFHAQLNALEVGKRRFTEALQQYGCDTILAAFEVLADRSERIMRSAFEELPEGVYEAEDYLDNDGLSDEPIRIAVVLTIKSGEIAVDFTGSSKACAGPLNIGEATAISACYVGLKHLFPDAPLNFGCFRPVEITIPDGSVLAAKSPTPVGGYNETVLRVASVVFQAFAKAVPERSYAVPYSVVNPLVVAGQKPEGGSWVMFIYFGGGLGGSAESDGLNHGCNPMSVATMPSVEHVEASYPVTLRQWALRPDSEGAGMCRGGLGAIYEFELKAEEATFTLLGDRGKYPPAGINGGEPAALNLFEYTRSGTWCRPPRLTKIANQAIKKGDRLRLQTPGGGGYGPPVERQAERIKEDVLAGYISQQRAVEVYGLKALPEETVVSGGTRFRKDVAVTERRGATK